MPELPEVETVRRGLAPVMEGQRIERAEVNRPDLRWPFPERMAERLTGAEVRGLRRRSKYILADHNSGEPLPIHLGMSGRLLISGVPLGQFVHDHPPPEKHDHVVVQLAEGARVTCNDPRPFGAWDLVATAAADEDRTPAPTAPQRSRLPSPAGPSSRRTPRSSRSSSPQKAGPARPSGPTPTARGTSPTAASCRSA